MTIEIDYQTAQLLMDLLKVSSYGAELADFTEELRSSIDNYEPGDTTDAFEGGFAANH